MGRGAFTDEEVRILLENPNVYTVKDNREIIYTNEFKQEFMERYLVEKKPTKIFREAGFDVKILGFKRIERAADRWKRSYEAGTLGRYGYPQSEKKQEKMDIIEKKNIQIRKERENNEKKIDRIEKKSQERLQKEKEKNDRKIEKIKKKSEEKIEKETGKLNRKIEKQEIELEALKKAIRLGRRNGKGTENGKLDIYNLINEIIEEYGLKGCTRDLCQLLELPRSDFYYYRSTETRRAERESRDLERYYYIKQVYDGCRYNRKGARTIKTELKKKYGIVYSRKTIRRIMDRYDLHCPMKTRNPYRNMWKATQQDKIAPNLINRDFKPGIPRKLFLTDITYIKGRTGFSYLVVIKDSQTNEPLAYEVSQSLKVDFVMKALDTLSQYEFSKGAIIHSDQGVHFTSRAFRERIEEMGLRQSMSRRGNCLDNAAMESFFGHMKQEVNFRSDMTHEEIKKEIDDYMKYYRYDRYQEGLGELTPYEYYNIHRGCVQ